MTQYKLTYFDIHGGRGEPLRLAFHIAGIKFEDNRLSFSEFRKQQASLPFKKVPILEIDGDVYTQSNALLRYVGRQTGLYPSDPLLALHCDEILDTMEDLTNFTVATFGLKGDELIAARAKLVDERFTVYIAGLEQWIARSGGPYLVSDTPTIADLKAFVWLDSIERGVLDHVPTDLIKTQAPKLADFYQRMQNHVAIQAYYGT